MHAEAAAEYLLAARAHGPGAPLPEALRPAKDADAVNIQRLTMARLGSIGGWKVGAAGPNAPPSCAPMPLSGLHESPASLPSNAFTTRDIESEIAFRLGQDLPPRPAAYTRADITAAISTCHPGIEILQSRFAEAGAVDPLSHLADLIRHGAYVVGAPIPAWQSIDFAAVEVTQTVADCRVVRTGNPAGDMLRLIAWLANDGAVWAGGLRAGQVITCGSWTASTPAPPSAAVETRFTVGAPVTLRFT